MNKGSRPVKPICFAEIRQLADALAFPDGGPAWVVNEKNLENQKSCLLAECFFRFSCFFSERAEASSGTSFSLVRFFWMSKRNEQYLFNENYLFIVPDGIKR